MDIAALSTVLSQNSTQQAVGISILKKAMDATDISADGVLNMLVPPSATIGTNVDISA